VTEIHTAQADGRNLMTADITLLHCPSLSFSLVFV